MGVVRWRRARSPGSGIVRNTGKTQPPPMDAALQRYGYACPKVADATCSGPWSAFIVLMIFLFVIAVLYLVQASMTLARRQRRTKDWRRWEAHKRRVAAPMQREGQDMVQALQDMVGGTASVKMGGSVTTGAVQPTSDIDIKIVANSCADYAAIANLLQQNPAYTHVHSGGKFALFSTTTPSGVPVDVSLEVQDLNKVTSANKLQQEQQADEREARGYLEHIIRRAHPDMTIRRDKTFN